MSRTPIAGIGGTDGEGDWLFFARLEKHCFTNHSFVVVLFCDRFTWLGRLFKWPRHHHQKHFEHEFAHN